jgi:hypothetical protein
MPAPAASAVYLIQHEWAGFLDAEAYYKRRNKTAIFAEVQAFHAFRVAGKQEKQDDWAASESSAVSAVKMILVPLFFNLFAFSSKV